MLINVLYLHLNVFKNVCRFSTTGQRRCEVLRELSETVVKIIQANQDMPKKINEYISQQHNNSVAAAGHLTLPESFLLGPLVPATDLL